MQTKLIKRLAPTKYIRNLYNSIATAVKQWQKGQIEISLKTFRWPTVIGKDAQHYTDHQGNANQNHIEVSPHTCQNEGYQKNRDNSARVWRKETPVLCWWESKLA